MHRHSLFVVYPSSSVMLAPFEGHFRTNSLLQHGTIAQAALHYTTTVASKANSFGQFQVSEGANIFAKFRLQTCPLKDASQMMRY